MASAAGLCILCNLEVTEEDYRREIDCPSKTCPGRIYHEDCIAGYLKRTKYSKDRCTGFPCPATLSSGKPCPGYVCKMHSFFPSNQKKKQARLGAAIAAATLPKPKGPPVVKPKVGAQAAIAAIKRVVAEGAPPVTVDVAKPASGASLSLEARLGTGARQQPRVIPGLVGHVQGLSSRDAVREQVAKLRAEAKAPVRATHSTPLCGLGRGTAAGKASDAKSKASMGREMGSRYASDSDDDQEMTPQQPTLWDAFARVPGKGGYVNYHQVEKQKLNLEDKFSARFRKRLEEDNSIHELSPEGENGTASEWGSFGTSSSTNRECDDTGLKVCYDDANSLPATTLQGEGYTDANAVSVTPTSRADMESCYTARVKVREDSIDEVESVVVAHGTKQALYEDPDDIILEYDVVYAAADGSFVVFDTVSNGYVRLEEFYGASPELVDQPAEDGNYYTCVAVRKAQQQIRLQWHETWLQQNIFNDSTTQQLATSPVHTPSQLLDIPTVPAVATVYMQSTMPSYSGTNSILQNLDGSGSAISPQGMDEQDELDDDGTDVASLMQLLCV